MLLNLLLHLSNIVNITIVILASTFKDFSYEFNCYIKKMCQIGEDTPYDVNHYWEYYRNGKVLLLNI